MLIEYTPNPEKLIEAAGRTCYNSTKQDPSIIRTWIKRGHLSVIEHASATFRIICSRVVSHELVRHRLASYSQRSQRYVSESEADFFVPPEIYENEIAATEYARIVNCCLFLYQGLIQEGFNKQIARYVLPNCTLTEIVMTMNFRELRHFISLRTSHLAQPEMRAMALKVLNICKEIAPNVFSDLSIDDHNNSIVSTNT